jgi:predicted ATP-grasp superfamily ATP-dependent carboligase
MFADLDLRHMARVLEVRRYPGDLVAATAAVAPCPWMYTGGLENHPKIVGSIARSRPLWGNGPEVLHRVRDPWHVAKLLEAARLPSLAIWPREAAPPDPDGRWMLKPLSGAGGRGISRWKPGASASRTLAEPHYFQQHVTGAPISAVCVASVSDTEVVGLTRQLVGLSEVHAPPFAWCGTITPVDLSAVVVETIKQIAQTLARGTGLRGLFGCDFLVDDSGVWLTEVNPRFPASTELVEASLGISLIDRHRRACDDSVGASPPAPATPGSTSVVGKIVLYADRDFTASDLSRFLLPPESTNGDRLPFVADLPVPGSRILRGQPVCTLFARAETSDACQKKLLRRARQIKQRLLN